VARSEPTAPSAEPGSGQIIRGLGQAPFRQRPARALSCSPGQVRRLRPAAQRRTSRGGCARRRPATSQGTTRSASTSNAAARQVEGVPHRGRLRCRHAGTAAEATAPHLFPRRETLSAVRPAGNYLLGQLGRRHKCHSNGTFRRARYSVPCSKDASELGAPLRNRTVDLLLTMGHQHVPEIAAAPLTRQMTSSSELAQAVPYRR
jgi:hypothetical protein